MADEGRNQAFRTESDLLGERQVPASAYYGVHTLRARENFQITGTTIAQWPELINALAAVKQAAALANARLGLLSQKKCDAICAACEEIRAGKLHEHFVLDVLQGGAGHRARSSLRPRRARIRHHQGWCRYCRYGGR